MIQSDPGPMTEKTKRNIQAARTREFHWGRSELHIQLWTGHFYFWPVLEKGLELHYGSPYYDQGWVSWKRCYWLTFGVYLMKPEGE